MIFRRGDFKFISYKPVWAMNKQTWNPVEKGLRNRGPSIDDEGIMF